MDKAQSKIILSATVIGALLGLGIGVVLAETKKEQLQLAKAYGEDKVIVQAGFREWIALSLAAISLIRNLANMLAPKV